MVEGGSGGLKLYNFVFEAQLNYLEIAISFDCSLQIIWKRGTQKVQTEEPVKLALNQGRAVFNETLKMNSTMYFDEAKQQFLEKKSQFTIVIITEKGNKIGGQCTIDLASYVINQIDQQEETLPLQKCPDQNSKLNFTMRVKYIGEGAAAEIPVQMEPTVPQNIFQGKLAQQIDLVTKSAMSGKTVQDKGVSQSNELKEKLSLIEKENGQLRKENNDLVKNIQKLQEGKEQNMTGEQIKLEDKCKQLQMQVQQQEGELQNYHQQVSQQDQYIKELMHQNSALKDQLQQKPEQNENQQCIEFSQFLLNCIVEEFEQFKIELSMLQDENSKLKKLLELVKKNPGTGEEKYEIETNELDELIATIKQLEEENMQLEEENRQLKEENQKQQQRFQKYKNQASVKLSDYIKEIDGLQEQLVKNKQMIGIGQYNLNNLQKGDAINFVAGNSNQEFLQEMMKQIKLS